MLKLDPVALTDVGRKREHNEDSLGDLIITGDHNFTPDKLAEKGYLFAVADGMGGYAAGEVASEMAISTLFNRYYNGPQSGSLAEDLMESIIHTNAEVFHAGSISGQGQMGTTLTLAVVKGNRVLVGNVGDSRTYLIRNGIPLRVTRDHSLVQDQIDIGALTPEQASKSVIRNIITRAIGHRDEVEPDLFEQELQKGDVILLCSDGLHGLVQEIEMGTIVATEPNLKQAAQRLIDLANERGGVDNISVVLVGITEVGSPIPTMITSKNGTHSGMTATMPVPLTERPTTQIPTPTGDYVDENSPVDIDAPTRLNPVPKKKRGGGLIFLLGFLILVIGGGIVAYVVLNNSGSTANTTPVPAATTTIVTISATVTPVPVPTVTASAITTTAAATTVSAVIVATNNPINGSAGGSNANISPPVITTATPKNYAVNRGNVQKLEVWLLYNPDNWPSGTDPSDYTLKIGQNGSGNISLIYKRQEKVNEKIYNAFELPQGSTLSLSSGVYTVTAFYKNELASAKGLRFTEQTIKVEDATVVAAADAVSMKDGTLQILYSWGSASNRRVEGEGQPIGGSEQSAPTPPTARP